VFCQVIVDIVHENVAKPFTYMVPDGMQLEAGQRVAVPFGPREKEGVVLGFSAQTDLEPARLKAVIRPLEEYAAIPPELMELAKEMALKVHCPLAETLRLMMPAQMRGGRIHVRTERYVHLNASGEAIREALTASRAGGKRARILEMMLEASPRSLREIGESIRDPREAVNRLVSEGLLRLTDEESLRTPGGALPEPVDPGYTLTEGQREALAEIIPALEKRKGRFLLHGVTASGKSEVFIAAVQKTLELGRSAIILVPEIALTPQMVAWFRGRFGSAAAVIHSRLSAGERFDEWRRIRRGEARVVIGARSAVFSPARDLGLIVIDEEHETTYLNDRHPRYDAREVAASRCGREGAVLILASATPSILSFARAGRGDYSLLEMPHRVANRPLPEVEIADMRQELENGNRTVLSLALRGALKQTMAEGGQAMLLMNRRGYNSFVSCRSCGAAVKCPQCDVSLTYHVGSRDNRLKCHYCGWEMAPPTVCPACGSRYIRYFGAGTQKVEEEVARLLPGVPLARMDLDTTGGKDGHGRILETFRSGKARILIGTQMIAKGLDFPQVTLVGVIAADLTLNMPDYRSRERTFQLLTQVAGRAGRGEKPGRVIIQTYRPEDPVIGFAARQDYRAFFEAEFRRRRISLYPPFTALVRLLVESPRENCAEQALQALEKQSRALLDQNPAWREKTLLFNREDPSVKMLRGKFRKQLMMKLLIGPETDAFCGALTELASQPFEGAEVWFEYNPATMM